MSETLHTAPAPFLLDGERKGSPDSRSQVVGSLLSISKSTRAFLALLLAEVDLHPGQDQLLSKLHHGEPISVSSLADQLAVRPSTVSKMLDRLIEKGFVRRQSHHGDARRTMVHLTDDGREARKAVHDVWSRLEKELASALGHEERERLQSALATMEGILIARLRRLR